MGKRRFALVSSSEDEEAPMRNDSREREKGKMLGVEDNEEEVERQNIGDPGRRGAIVGRAIGGHGGSGGGGSGGRDGGKGEGEEESALEDAKPKGPVLRVSGKGKRKKRHYRSFEYEGNTIELEDLVLLTPEDRKQKPYVAIIKDITQDVDGKMMVTG